MIEDKKAPIWSLVTLISLASVALVVGGIYVVRAPLMNAGSKMAAAGRGAVEGMRNNRRSGDMPPNHPPPPMADYAFDFDF